MSKDDPLNLFANRTLWIDREHMDIARARFYNAWAQYAHPGIEHSGERATWEIAWAAAIAAFSFLQEGNLGPRPDSEVDHE